MKLIVGSWNIWMFGSRNFKGIGRFVEDSDIDVLTGDFNSLPQNKEIENIEKMLTRVGGDKPTWTVHPWENFGWKVDGLKYQLDNIVISKVVKP